MVIFRDLVDSLQRRLEAEGKSGTQGGGSFARAVTGAAGYVQHQWAVGQADVMRPPRHLEPGARRRRASAYGRAARLSYDETTKGGAGRLALRGLAVVAVMAVVFMATSSTYISFASDLPDARTLAANPPADDTLLYASDGSVMADIHQPGYEHYQQKLSDMGAFLPQATVAIEDANFYNESGIDVQGIVRAAYVDWRAHGTVQGASTITQQLVKLRLLHDTSPTISRKLKEAVLALQVSQTYSKDQILEMYLNTVFYGNSSYGIEAAAKNYFHTDTAHLDLAQAAMLAGIPRDPTYANPFVNWEGAKARQYQVLQAMVQKLHVITQADATKAFNEDLSPPKHLFRAYTVDSYPAFDSYVAGLLRAQYGDGAAFGGGLRVYTTLNPALQAAANKAVMDNLRINGPYKHFSQSALVSIDPHTGAIVAMVGSAGPGSAGGQYNFAVWPPRNPGSSMKIYNYTAAIASKKFTMVSRIVDSPLRMQQPDGSWWEPKNYDLRYHGTCELQQCMGNSLNVPAVKVELGTGVANVVQMARDMGAPPWSCHKWGSGGCLDWRDDDPLNYYGPALTLGSYGETVLQMATGASVLAAQGVLHQPIAYTKILSEDGSLLYMAHPDQTAKQVIDPGVAWILETIMSNDNNRAMIFGRGSALTLPDYRVGAKTGTYDRWTDGWTLGYTPSLVSAVWSGNADGSPMVTQADGVFVAAPAWHQYMDDALHAMHAPNTWFTQPPDVVTAQPGLDGIYFLPGTSWSTPVPPMPPGVITSGSGGFYFGGEGGAPPPGGPGPGGGGHKH
ncbi:MAG TPA: transglycosylase domain-containing protein [Candidatus Dormibacteraeota bacterium]